MPALLISPDITQDTQCQHRTKQSASDKANRSPDHHQEENAKTITIHRNGNKRKCRRAANNRT